MCSLWKKHKTSQLQNVFFLLNDVLNSVLEPPLTDEAEKVSIIKVIHKYK